MRDLCNTDKPLFAVLTKLTYSAVVEAPMVTMGRLHTSHKMFR